MTDKELRKLNRAELLELFLEQCRRNEALEKELNEVKAQLEDKNLKIRKAGSLAEASLALSGIFEEAQKAADLYLQNVRYMTGAEEPPVYENTEYSAPEYAEPEYAEPAYDEPAYQEPVAFAEPEYSAPAETVESPVFEAAPEFVPQDNTNQEVYYETEPAPQDTFAAASVSPQRFPEVSASEEADDDFLDINYTELDDYGFEDVVSEMEGKLDQEDFFRKKASEPVTNQSVAALFGKTQAAEAGEEQEKRAPRHIERQRIRNATGHHKKL